MSILGEFKQIISKLSSNKKYQSTAIAATFVPTIISIASLLYPGIALAIASSSLFSFTSLALWSTTAIAVTFGFISALLIVAVSAATALIYAYAVNYKNISKKAELVDSQDISKLNEDNADLQLQLFAAQQRIQSLNTSCESLQKSLDTKEKQTKSLHKQCYELKNHNNRLKTKLVESRTMTKNLKDKTNKQKSSKIPQRDIRVLNLSTQLNNATKDITELKAHNAQLNNISIQLIKDNYCYKNYVDELKYGLNGLESLARNLDKELNNTKLNNAQLTEKNVTLSYKLSSIHTMNQQLDANHALILSNMALIQTDLSTTKEKLLAAENKLTKQDELMSANIETINIKSTETNSKNNSSIKGNPNTFYASPNNSMYQSFSESLQNTNNDENNNFTQMDVLACML